MTSRGEKVGDGMAIGERTRRTAGAIALVALLMLGVCASSASAAPLSMTFTEARANVGKQLSDAALFAPPATAPLAAQIDPASGAITAGTLDVPEFQTHITAPIDADVTVDFEIGIVSGSFNEATGALTLEGQAGGTLRSVGTTSGQEGECTVSTGPENLRLSTAGSSGGANPRFGAPFTVGLTGPGTIAGTWTDMTATPVDPDDPSEFIFCNDVYNQIGGVGGVWLQQEGDLVPPAAPQLQSTDPGSPGASGTPRIRGAAEAGSTVRLYAGPDCAGTPVATGSAAELGSPGLSVDVAEGVTATFSATATDAARNTSPCSTSISYTRLKAPSPTDEKPSTGVCVVPKLAGKTLARARVLLKAANCKLGKVSKPKLKGKRRALVVKSQNPRPGAKPANRKVHLKLGLKPRKAHHARHAQRQTR